MFLIVLTEGILRGYEVIVDVIIDVSQVNRGSVDYFVVSLTQLKHLEEFLPIKHGVGV